MIAPVMVLPLFIRDYIESRNCFFFITDVLLIIITISDIYDRYNQSDMHLSVQINYEYTYIDLRVIFCIITETFSKITF